jgi:hypothetical protein
MSNQPKKNNYNFEQNNLDLINNYRNKKFKHDKSTNNSSYSSALIKNEPIDHNSLIRDSNTTEPVSVEQSHMKNLKHEYLNQNYATSSSSNSSLSSPASPQQNDIIQSGHYSSSPTNLIFDVSVFNPACKKFLNMLFCLTLLVNIIDSSSHVIFGCFLPTDI